MPAAPAPLVLTTLDGTEHVLGEPGRMVIVEVVRSLDWCVYCMAQLRAWQGVLPRVEALDADLVVLSPDSPEVLERVVAKRRFPPAIVAHGTAEQFARLKVPSDPHRPSLPRTTTLVFDETGGEILRFSDADYRARVDPGVTLDQITLDQGLPLPDAPKVPSPDWDAAATIGLVREGGQVVLDVVIAPGFHLYGSSEATSVPLALKLADGTAAEVPPGERTDQNGIEAWLLEGALKVAVAAPADEEVRGEVGWQLCNDRSCSAPRFEPFVLAPDEGRIIRPSAE